MQNVAVACYSEACMTKPCALEIFWEKKKAILQQRLHMGISFAVLLKKAIKNIEIFLTKDALLININV